LAAVLTHPLVVGVVGVGTLWLWHMPNLYEAALRNDLTHAAEHTSFLGPALLFWGIVLAHGRRVHVGPALLLVFATMLQSGGLGALIVFAQTPLYASHEAGAAAWGLTPLQDQQLAGTIMWVPMGVVYLLAALWLVAAWLGAMDRATPANEQAPDDRVAVPRASEGGIA
jgi:cytochrome c oxidase assembly factor CtaG